MDIDLKRVIEQKSPGFFRILPRFFAAGVLRFLEKVNHLDEVRDFLRQSGGKRDWEFIDALFKYLDFRYILSGEDITKIPRKGALICVANHSLGALDGLSLLKVIGSVRKDVKIVVNDILVPLENMKEMFLFYDLYSSSIQKTNIQKIRSALAEGSAIIFFPAGTVAKLTYRGVQEASWNTGPVVFAQKYSAPILPVYVNARSSLLYYLVSWLNPELASLFLAQAMFSHRSRSIGLKVGKLIPSEELERQGGDVSSQTEFLREHVLGLQN